MESLILQVYGPITGRVYIGGGRGVTGIFFSVYRGAYKRSGGGGRGAYNWDFTVSKPAHKSSNDYSPLITLTTGKKLLAGVGFEPMSFMLSVNCCTI